MKLKLLILILVVLLVAGGVYFWKYQPADVEEEVMDGVTVDYEIEVDSTNEPVGIVTGDYTNTKYGYSVSLPESYKGYFSIEDFDYDARIPALYQVLFAPDPAWWTSGFIVLVVEDRDARIADIKESGLSPSEGTATIGDMTVDTLTVGSEIGYSVIHYFVEANGYVFDIKVLTTNEEAIAIIESMVFSEDLME